MKRRHFMAVLGGATAASALAHATRAQTPAPTAAQSANVPLVGFLNSASAATYRFNADAFREGLARAGFVEGRNVRIEERWANSDYQALPRSPPSWWPRASSRSRRPATWCRRAPRKERARRSVIGAKRVQLLHDLVPSATRTDPVMLARREQIVALAERHALPAVSFTRPFALAGGLMSYAPDIGWMYRQAGGYIGQISKVRSRPKCRSCNRRASSSC